MNIAVILAAGNSTRLGGETPKQFKIINEKPVFMYSVNAFLNVKEIDEIYIVCAKEYFDEIQKYAGFAGDFRIKTPIIGGKTRQESVKNALDVIYQNHDKNDVILIHDSARALLTEDIIIRNIEASKKYHAITTAIPLHDTVATSLDQKSLDAFQNRDILFSIQTPQTFRLATIYAAHEAAKLTNLTATDDARLVQDNGGEIHIVLGNKNNFKITTIEDLKLFEALLQIK